MPERDTSGQLVRYLADAHSIEEQALAQLRSAPDIAGEDRLADVFDETVRASIAGLDPDGLQKRLVSYLADAHALEQQSIGLLQRAVDVAGASDLEAGYRAHLEESRGHLERIEARLEALDA